MRISDWSSDVCSSDLDLLTGIHSEETHLPQPLLISITADLEPTPEYRPQTPLGFSKDYLDLRNAALQAIPRDLHFTLIESIADHIANTLFAEDVRVRTVSIKIVKVAISESGEAIGMTLIRHRRHWHEARSEEHTSELQSLMRNSYAVFCLNKKK